MTLHPTNLMLSGAGLRIGGVTDTHKERSRPGEERHASRVMGSRQWPYWFDSEFPMIS